MKKKTRPLALLMAAAILGSTLTACGGGSDTGIRGSDASNEGLAEDMALTDAPAGRNHFAHPAPTVLSCRSLLCRSRSLPAR